MIAVVALVGLIILIGAILWYGTTLKPHGDRREGEYGPNGSSY